jgi:hypothetical protein
MFKLITLQDTIRIPPETFGNPLEKVGREQVKQKYEGVVDEELAHRGLGEVDRRPPRGGGPGGRVSRDLRGGLIPALAASSRRFMQMLGNIPLFLRP